MMKNLKFILTILISIMIFAGCSADITKVSLPRFDKSVQKLSGVKPLAGYEPYISLGEFKDSRAEDSIAEVDGESIPADRDPATVALDAVRGQLEAKGFRFSEAAPVVLTGQLRKWSASTSGSIRSKIDSEATIYIEVLDPANRRVYSGVYNGYTSRTLPGFEEKDIRAALKASLLQAIKQLVSDEALIKTLSAY